MQQQNCAKCDGTELLTIPGNIGFSGAGSNIPVGWRALNAIPVERRVCTSCGFVESWVSDPADLATLREKFGQSK